ncbi:MAG: hypothetical protein R3B93_01425 [Bacteroidia bacterium]
MFSRTAAWKIKALSKNTEVATITITEIDYSKKTVSGTFSFDAYDEDDPGKIYEIRDGSLRMCRLNRGNHPECGDLL